MRKLGVPTYRQLVERSLADPEWYWRAVIDDLEIRFLTPFDQVVDLTHGVEWPKWFTGGQLNVVDHCVDRNSQRRPDAVALIWENEAGRRTAVSYSELRDRVDQVASRLADLGVSLGDRVGLVMPMCPEAVFALYATLKLGAVGVPTFSGFSAEAIRARFADAEVRAVITCRETTRRGRTVELEGTVREAIADLDGTQLIVMRSEPGADQSVEAGVAGGSAVETVSVPSEHPAMLNYTSGTTGKPKAVVHVHGGLLVKVASEAAYLTDLHPRDVILWITDLG
jgi:acetyl-CoA synthetase